MVFVLNNKFDQSNSKVGLGKLESISNSVRKRKPSIFIVNVHIIKYKILFSLICQRSKKYFKKDGEKRLHVWESKVKLCFNLLYFS